MSVEGNLRSRGGAPIHGRRAASLLAGLAAFAVGTAQCLADSIHSAVRSNDLVAVKEILTADPGAVNTIIGNGISGITAARTLRHAAP